MNGAYKCGSCGQIFYGEQAADNMTEHVLSCSVQKNVYPSFPFETIEKELKVLFPLVNDIEFYEKEGRECKIELRFKDLMTWEIYVSFREQKIEPVLECIQKQKEELDRILHQLHLEIPHFRFEWEDVEMYLNKGDETIYAYLSYQGEEENKEAKGHTIYNGEGKDFISSVRNHIRKLI